MYSLNTDREKDQPEGGIKIKPARKANPISQIVDELLPEDIERFNESLEKALKPQREYLTDNEYQIYKRGKKIRPIMLMLAARLVFGDGILPEKVIKGAVSLEMLHVATLIHDDIIDDALMRRGLTSVNASRGTKTAILVGDLQFVQAIRGFAKAVDTEKDMNLVRIVLDTAFRICCGELDELKKDPPWDLEVFRERYYQTIERKTAVLFGLACEAGASLGGSRTSDARRIGFYGRRVGRAFQIMDDLLDFIQEDETAGKKMGQDLAQHRWSLPIIYAVDELGPEHMVSKIMHNKEKPGEKELVEGIAAVKRTAGFQKAYAEAREQAIDSLEYLAPFPHNQYRDVLEELALYVVDRNF